MRGKNSSLGVDVYILHLKITDVHILNIQILHLNIAALERHIRP